MIEMHLFRRNKRKAVKDVMPSDDFLFIIDKCALEKKREKHKLNFFFILKKWQF